MNASQDKIAPKKGWSITQNDWNTIICGYPILRNNHIVGGMATIWICPIHLGQWLTYNSNGDAEPWLFLMCCFASRKNDHASVVLTNGNSRDTSDSSEYMKCRYRSSYTEQCQKLEVWSYNEQQLLLPLRVFFICFLQLCRFFTKNYEPLWTVNIGFWRQVSITNRLLPRINYSTPLHTAISISPSCAIPFH